jgi:hypothetical protein
MNGIKILIGIVVLTLVVVKIDSSLFGQNGNEQIFLRNLKVGDWVKLEGTAQKDSTILLSEIKVILGELEDDDWEISGVVSRVVAEDKKIYILRLPIIFDRDTKYGYRNAIKSFSDIETGIYVELEGSFLNDGTFLAVEIGKEKISEDEKDVVEWKGKVQSVNPAENAFTILGHTAILTPETKIKSYIHN